MKFYVFTTLEERLQVINCDDYILAVLNHKWRAKKGDELAQKWFEALAMAVPIEAGDAVEAKEIYEAIRSN